MVNITTKLGPVGAKLTKYSPEILLGVGIFGVIGGTVLACRGTRKLDDVIADRTHEAEQVSESYLAEAENAEDCEAIAESKEYKKALTKVYFKHGARVIALYAPAAVATTIGIACIIGSHNIQSGRIAGLAAAYSAATLTLDEYRGRIRDELGDEKELELYRNIQEGEIEVTKTLKSGKEKIVKQKVHTLDPDHRSMYTFIFDESNPNFVRGGGYNKSFLIMQENFANSKFDLQGYLYLNDVLESIGFDTKDLPWTRVVGWVKGMGDDYVDFGVFEAYDKTKCDFVNCTEPSIWLDFNVDGYIFDKLGVAAPPLSSADEEYLAYSETMKDE